MVKRKSILKYLRVKIMLKKLTALLLLGVFITGLSACGVKGPLYFPAKEESQTIN